ncbi:MAG: hypothetical protein M3N14_01530 [Bacteroidota bacterium]|nr:hypothetical protein [Bacteroidota bacterium]
MENTEINLLIETNRAILAKIDSLNKRLEAIENNFEVVDENGLKQAILIPIEQLNDYKNTALPPTGSY